MEEVNLYELLYLWEPKLSDCSKYVCILLRELWSVNTPFVWMIVFYSQRTYTTGHNGTNSGPFLIFRNKENERKSERYREKEKEREFAKISFKAWLNFHNWHSWCAAFHFNCFPSTFYSSFFAKSTLFANKQQWQQKKASLHK